MTGGRQKGRQKGHKKPSAKLSDLPDQITSHLFIKKKEVDTKSLNPLLKPLNDKIPVLIKNFWKKSKKLFTFNF